MIDRVIEYTVDYLRIICEQQSVKQRRSKEKKEEEKRREFVHLETTGMSDADVRTSGRA